MTCARAHAQLVDGGRILGRDVDRGRVAHPRDGQAFEIQRTGAHAFATHLAAESEVAAHVRQHRADVHGFDQLQSNASRELVDAHHLTEQRTHHVHFGRDALAAAVLEAQQRLCG
ncbi:MAG: hypothetical protein KC503_00325 [Myxococcales bacterium]|nr:hypothetical protein [Myxococcales bacterium]